MATITKDLGPVTAYKYAVSAGYEGTEEEFAQLMADLANILPILTQIQDDLEQVEGTIIDVQDELDDKLAKTGDEVLELSGSVPRVSVAATNVASRFVASDNSNLTGLWDENQGNWIISRNTSGVTHLPGYWTFTTSSATSTHFQQVIKNADGLMIIIMRVTVNVAINNSSGDIYYGTATLPDFSETFSAKPTVTYSTESGGTAGNAWVWGRTAPSTTNPGGIYLGRGGSTAASNYIVNVHAIGRVAT